MSPQETLRLARARGITIEVAGEKLRVAPAAAVDSVLREALAAHKAELLRLLGPILDSLGLPVRQCAFCGCPSWWTSYSSPGWHCASCNPRPDPFHGRSVVVAGGEWLIH